MLKSSFTLPALTLILIFLIIIPGSKSTKTTDVNLLYQSQDRVMVAAHRGSHSNFPENSLAAIEESVRQGVDIVEIDIRETRDHIPVLMHDKSLSRTTTGNKLLTDHDYSDLQHYRLLSKGKPSPHKIPSLEEVLQFAKNRIILNLDFKLEDLDAMKRAYELIEKYEMEESVIFTVNELKLIPDLNRLNPDIQMMPVAFNAWKIERVLNNDFIDLIQLYHRPYWKYNMKRFEKRNIDIWVNSLGKYDEMEKNGENGFEKLIGIKKVDIIQTDYPEELLTFLRTKGLHD